jgi:hypothetical protein
MSVATNANMVLLEWKQAKEVLEAAKAKEMELRKHIVSKLHFFNPDNKKGTENYDLGNGYSLKCVKKENYKIENKKGEAFRVLSKMQELSISMSASSNGEERAFGEQLQEITKELFSFDANLKLTQFEKLPKGSAARKLVEDILTITDGSPTLELVTPKE